MTLPKVTLPKVNRAALAKHHRIIRYGVFGIIVIVLVVLHGDTSAGLISAALLKVLDVTGDVIADRVLPFDWLKTISKMDD